MSEQSAKPYLVRAICEWCADNGLTPYLNVKVNAETRVPRRTSRTARSCSTSARRRRATSRSTITACAFPRAFPAPRRKCRCRCPRSSAFSRRRRATVSRSRRRAGSRGLARVRHRAAGRRRRRRARARLAQERIREASRQGEIAAAAPADHQVARSARRARRFGGRAVPTRPKLSCYRARARARGMTRASFSCRSVARDFDHVEARVRGPIASCSATRCDRARNAV